MTSDKTSGAVRTPRVAFQHLSRAELDLQLSPSRSAKDFLGVLDRHVAETASLDGDSSLDVRWDIAFGPKPRQRFDFVARRDGQGPRPCLAFIHGGFWQEGSKAGSGFAARAFAGAGFAHASVGYTLAPEARLTEIVSEIAGFLRHLKQDAAALGVDPARIVLAGHSAGGQLAAAILAGLGGREAAETLAGVVLISGVYDLEPVAASYVNDLARMDAAEIAALSPLLHQPALDVPMHVLVGADEPEAFRRQSDALFAAWGARLSSISRHVAPGRDHFDVLDELADPASPTHRAALAMGGGGLRLPLP